MSSVLLVDDERGYRDYLQHGLAESDIHVQAAASTDEAKHILADGPVDLLVTDIRLPNGTDGLDLAEWARQRDAELELLVMTGYGSSEYEQRSHALGAFAYIEKPFELPTLVTWVRRALDHRGLLREVHRLDQALAAARASTPDRAGLREWPFASIAPSGAIRYATPAAMAALEAVSDPAAPRPLDRLEPFLVQRLRDALPSHGDRLGHTVLFRRDGVLSHYTALVRAPESDTAGELIVLFVEPEVELDAAGDALWLDILFKTATLADGRSHRAG